MGYTESHQRIPVVSLLPVALLALGVIVNAGCSSYDTTPLSSPIQTPLPTLSSEQPTPRVAGCNGIGDSDTNDDWRPLHVRRPDNYYPDDKIMYPDQELPTYACLWRYDPHGKRTDLHDSIIVTKQRGEDSPPFAHSEITYPKTDVVTVTVGTGNDKKQIPLKGCLEEGCYFSEQQAHLPHLPPSSQDVSGSGSVTPSLTTDRPPIFLPFENRDASLPPPQKGDEPSLIDTALQILGALGIDGAIAMGLNKKKPGLGTDMLKFQLKVLKFPLLPLKLIFGGKKNKS